MAALYCAALPVAEHGGPRPGSGDSVGSPWSGCDALVSARPVSEDPLPQPAQPTVQVDDERFRVTEWRFPPDSETGWHRHDMDYVVVPMTTGKLLLQTPDGESITSHLAAGQSYTRRAGNEHNVVNLGEHEFVFVEIEAK